jgi:hypothetical protein
VFCLVLPGSFSMAVVAKPIVRFESFAHRSNQR